MHMATATIQKQLNFNIGVLGHVDSGKTSLGKNNTSYVTRPIMVFELHYHTFSLSHILSACVRDWVKMGR